MQWAKRLGGWVLGGLAASAGSLCGVSVAGTSQTEPGPVPVPQNPIRAKSVGENHWHHKRSRLAEECEAFLAGRYHEVIGRCETVPGWVCVNAVAHAQRADLECMAGQSGCSGDRLSAGMSYLAGEVLAACDRHGLPLRQAQREVLVPLEFELSAPADRPTDLAALVGVVRSRLEVADESDRSRRMKQRGLDHGGLKHPGLDGHA
jgi:hypothetical protein